MSTPKTFIRFDLHNSKIPDLEPQVNPEKIIKIINKYPKLFFTLIFNIPRYKYTHIIKHTLKLLTFVSFQIEKIQENRYFIFILSPYFVKMVLKNHKTP